MKNRRSTCADLCGRVRYGDIELASRSRSDCLEDLVGVHGDGGTAALGKSVDCVVCAAEEHLVIRVLQSGCRKV